MTSNTFSHSDRTMGPYRPWHPNAEVGLRVTVALLLVWLSVSTFAISTTFGIVATFTLIIFVSVAVPVSVPVVIICAFLYQNMMVAWFTPLIANNTAFDAMRGANFVILVAAYCVFFAASFQPRARAIAPLRSWLLLNTIVLLVILFYFGLGVLHGTSRDAVIYLRNTVTPLACFQIAIVVASLYRIDLRKSIMWLGAGAIVYGYCELTFALKFLGLFHGDLYIERAIHREIETGKWERTLKQTGFVLRNLKDVMMTSFFNTPLFGNIFPEVFRIGGPNFHSISYAYALSVISAWLLFKGRWLLPLLALPLLLVIGSKGATFVLLIAIFARLAIQPLGARLTVVCVLLISAAWVTGAFFYGMATGGYHVLGLIAGVRDFLADPFGHGLGLGGNLSSTSLVVNWNRAQATGYTSIPVESAVGVMLFQMGIGSFAFFGLIIAIATTARRYLFETGNRDFLFAFVCVTAISANAVLQEEAYFSPLALGLCLLIVGSSLGTHLSNDHRWPVLSDQYWG